MLVVHLIRKPLSEGNVASNVLKWGCGALNIKASKIAYPSGKPESGWAKTGSKGEEGYLKESNFRIRNRSAEEIQERVSDGRWPANLILQHKAECQQTGVRRVPTGTAHQGKKTIGSKIYCGGWDLKGTSDLAEYGDEDGKETIPKWECVEGCPVADLDDVSGVLASGARSNSVGEKGQFGTAIYGDSTGRKQGSTFVSSSGGASRFFKQEDPQE